IHAKGWLRLSVHRPKPIVKFSQAKEVPLPAPDARDTALPRHLLDRLQMTPQFDCGLFRRKQGLEDGPACWGNYVLVHGCYLLNLKLQIDLAVPNSTGWMLSDTLNECRFVPHIAFLP